MADRFSSSGFSVVQRRIEEIADLAGVAGSARLSLDETLAAFPWTYRRRLVLTLESLKAFSPDAAVRQAAELYRLRAAQIWAAMPYEAHRNDDPARSNGPKSGNDFSDDPVAMTKGNKRSGF